MGCAALEWHFAALRTFIGVSAGPRLACARWWSTKGRIFLVKHSYVAGWHLPGGGVEAGETLVEAVTRELQEEGNIEVTKSPRLHGMFFNDRDSRRDHVALFVVRAFRQDAAPVPDHEIVAHGFFSVDELPNDTTAGTRARIVEVLGGAPVSERW